MDNSLPPFEVGERIVAIRTVIGQSGKINKGDEYVVNALFKCKCGWSVDVGLTSAGSSKCMHCGVFISNSANPAWAKNFRRISPYQNSVSRSLAEQALKDTGDSRQDMKPEKEIVNN